MRKEKRKKGKENVRCIPLIKQGQVSFEIVEKTLICLLIILR